MSRFTPSRMGWLRDLPDLRDFDPTHDYVRSLLAELPTAAARSGSVDLRLDEEGRVRYFSEVSDQGESNCSAALAVLAMVDYFERRSHGRTFEGSAGFLDKAARAVMQTNGDTGTGLRSTLKALRRFGVPPADLWDHQMTLADSVSRTIIAAGYASEFQDLCYVRLDSGRRAVGQRPATDLGRPQDDSLLATIKSFLTAGFPVAFGFSVPTTITAEPLVLFRPGFDSICGGQVVVAVGYDDCPSESPSVGALLVRNSWGIAWGTAGYGWLPYSYVEYGCAADFWSILRTDWLASGEYERPNVCKVAATG